jgi:hypothetical protein
VITTTITSTWYRSRNGIHFQKISRDSQIRKRIISIPLDTEISGLLMNLKFIFEFFQVQFVAVEPDAIIGGLQVLWRLDFRSGVHWRYMKGNYSRRYVYKSGSLLWQSIWIMNWNIDFHLLFCRLSAVIFHLCFYISLCLCQTIERCIH